METKIHARRGTRKLFSGFQPNCVSLWSPSKTVHSAHFTSTKLPSELKKVAKMSRRNAGDGHVDHWADLWAEPHCGLWSCLLLRKRTCRPARLLDWDPGVISGLLKTKGLLLLQARKS